MITLGHVSVHINLAIWLISCTPIWLFLGNECPALHFSCCANWLVLKLSPRELKGSSLTLLTGEAHLEVDQFSNYAPESFARLIIALICAPRISVRIICATPLSEDFAIPLFEYFARNLRADYLRDTTRQISFKIITGNLYIDPTKVNKSVHVWTTVLIGCAWFTGHPNRRDDPFCVVIENVASRVGRFHHEQFFD